MVLCAADVDELAPVHLVIIDGVAWSVCMSVCLCVHHGREPCENG